MTTYHRAHNDPLRKSNHKLKHFYQSWCNPEFKEVTISIQSNQEVCLEIPKHETQGTVYYKEGALIDKTTDIDYDLQEAQENAASANAQKEIVEQNKVYLQNAKLITGIAKAAIDQAMSECNRTHAAAIKATASSALQDAIQYKIVIDQAVDKAVQDANDANGELVEARDKDDPTNVLAQVEVAKNNADSPGMRQ